MAYASWSVIFGETPSAAKWNILGANDASLRDGTGILINNNQPIQSNNASSVAKDLIKKNASNQTLVGENNVRATRFVPVTPNVKVASSDPTTTNWATVDLSAYVSARAYAVELFGLVRSATTAGRILAVEADGTAGTIGVVNTIAVNPTATSVSGVGTRITLLSASQKIEYAVSNADVSLAELDIIGYWEYVD